MNCGRRRIFACEYSSTQEFSKGLRVQGGLENTIEHHFASIKPTYPGWHMLRPSNNTHTSVKVSLGPVGTRARVTAAAQTASRHNAHAPVRRATRARDGLLVLKLYEAG